MRLNLRRISFFEVTALPEFKEKPKMGAPKTKRRDMLLPKQAARIMKEKYLQELDQRPEGSENTEMQAVNIRLRGRGTSQYGVQRQTGGIAGRGL